MSILTSFLTYFFFFFPTISQMFFCDKKQSGQIEVYTFMFNTTSLNLKKGQKSCFFPLSDWRAACAMARCSGDNRRRIIGLKGSECKSSLSHSLLSPQPTTVIRSDGELGLRFILHIVEMEKV